MQNLFKRRPPKEEHPLLSFVAYLAEAFMPSSRYIPYSETQWHPIYSNTKLSPEKRRELREAELPYEWTAEVWRACKAFWWDSCAACGRHTDALERDHIIPIADVRCPGGTVENLIPLCKGCNIDKGANDLAIWHRENFHSLFRTTRMLDKIAMWQRQAGEVFPPEERSDLRKIAKAEYTHMKRKMKRPVKRGK